MPAITVSLRKGSGTPCAAVAQVLRVSHSVPGLPDGFLRRTGVLQNQGQQLPVVAVALHKEQYKAANSFFVYIHTHTTLTFTARQKHVTG